MAGLIRGGGGWDVAVNEGAYPFRVVGLFLMQSSWFV